MVRAGVGTCFLLTGHGTGVVKKVVQVRPLPAPGPPPFKLPSPCAPCACWAGGVVWGVCGVCVLTDVGARSTWGRR
eukprot:1290779-Rhodomonas_salina.1